MTSDQQRQFEHQWPALALRVLHLLRRKRASSWLAEDLTQETGLRLIRMWPEIDQTKPIWPLAATIALNLLRDERRKGSATELSQAVPDTPSQENVERRGLARLELRAVGGALSQMTDAHRQVLLSAVEEESAAPDASATRMLRMRARRKLQHLMDHASLLGIALGDQLRRVVREAEIMIGRVLPGHAESISAAAISLLAAVSLGLAITPDRPAGALPSEGGGSITRDADGGTLGSEASSGAGVGDASRAELRRTRWDADRRGGDRDRKRVDERSGNTIEDGTRFPGVARYRMQLTEDTYARGEVDAEIVGKDELDTSRGDQPGGTGSIDCTVSPSHTGASCTHSGQGWSERGIRARHRGEASVAGHEVG